MYVLFALFMGLILFGSGALLQAMGAGGKSRNPVVGYRTARSMKSPETWIAANRYAAKASYIAGAAILLIGALLWWRPLPEYNEMVITGALLVSLAGVILATETYLKRHFNADGTPKAIPPGEMDEPAPALAVEVKRAGKLPYSRLEYLLEIISLTGVILGAILLLHHWPQLPGLVPRHYDFQGVVDAWGGKGSVLALPITNVLLYLVLTLMRIFIPSYSGNSSSRRSLILSMELLAWVKAWTVWTFTYLTWSTVEIALERAAALSPVFLPLVMVTGLVIIAIYCILIIRVKNGERKRG